MLSQWLMQKTSTGCSHNQYVYKLTRSLEELPMVDEELPMIDAAFKFLSFKHKGNIWLEKIWFMLINVVLYSNC